MVETMFPVDDNQKEPTMSDEPEDTAYGTSMTIEQHTNDIQDLLPEIDSIREELETKLGEYVYAIGLLVQAARKAEAEHEGEFYEIQVAAEGLLNDVENIEFGTRPFL
jgi:hypothetical protein